MTFPALGPLDLGVLDERRFHAGTEEGVQDIRIREGVIVTGSGRAQSGEHLSTLARRHPSNEPLRVEGIGGIDARLLHPGSPFLRRIRALDLSL